jgi:exonuclease SbcC
LSDFVLKSLEVNNFRSISGRIHAPLDAKVVLLHGENGAGKTSLLSAIEFALTGAVQSLHSADPNYQKQLLHFHTDGGGVELKVQAGAQEEVYKTTLDANGADSISSLEKRRANFFQERVFLPQSMLGRLLQIYQESGNDKESPLAKFVTGLLGLDRLDALEAGLQPLADIRNVRKMTDGWQKAENDEANLERQLSEYKKSRDIWHEQVIEALASLKTIHAKLGLDILIAEESFEDLKLEILDEADSETLAENSNQRRKLTSIKLEIEEAKSESEADLSLTSNNLNTAAIAFSNWEREFGPSIIQLRSRIETLLPNVSLPNDPESLVEVALSNLQTLHKQLSSRTSQARDDIKMYADTLDRLDVAQRQIAIIDDEISSLSENTGSLGALLTEISLFITDDICPVCDRDFDEAGDTSLNEHVNRKVHKLSASSERLLTIGRTRSETQVKIDQLKREAEMILSRKLDEESLAVLDRRKASFLNAISEVNSSTAILREGGQLRTLAVSERRAISAAQSRRVALSSALTTINEFAISIGSEAVEESETFENAISRLDGILSARSEKLEERLSYRNRGIEIIRAMEVAIERRNEVDESISAVAESKQKVEDALMRARTLRDNGNKVRLAVDEIRSTIIRREFNDRLNLLWRDLFVRLAPGEPFVPAFRIPESATRRIQPKLITQHRTGGDAGGTPGAMLSAGNLNTAALTLFTALHLSMPVELPCLILDDPVQSMDDVHIAHFAALLRTLSKEHNRQIIIAVHDRQLFEYLKLELSPAFVDDSLLTLELSRGMTRDTVCVSRRYSYEEETALLALSA